MTRPRVLVVRSGEKPFLEPGAAPHVDVVERVTHDVEPVESPAEAFDGPFDLVLFTSRIAVGRSLEGRTGSVLRPVLERARRGAVGDATAAVLRSAGLDPEVVAGGSASALLAALPSRLDGARILLPCGEDASPGLARGLEARGAKVARVVVYRKVPRPREERLWDEVLGSGFAAFCATSTAAARWLFEGAGAAAEPVPSALPAVVLGEPTAAFLRGRGVAHVEIAARPRFSDALALLEALACPPSGQ